MKNTLPPIFVISLADAHRRREHMRKMLNDLSLEYEFVDAVDGRLLDAEGIKPIYDRSNIIKLFEKGLNLTEAACYMSHVKVMQIVQDRGLDSALVLEDDVLISPDIKPFLQNLSKLPKDWNIVHLAAGGATPDFPNVNVTGWHRKSWRVYKDYEGGIPHGANYGALGYLVKRTFAEQFLQHAYPVRLAIDYKLFDIRVSFSSYYALKEHKLVSPAKMPSILKEHRRKKHKTTDKVTRTKDVSRKPASSDDCRLVVRVLKWLRGFCFRQARRFLIYFFPPRKYDGEPTLGFDENHRAFRVDIIRFLLTLHLGWGNKRGGIDVYRATHR